MKVTIAGGGTAGHVNPALALADQLAREHEVSFVGTESGVEAKLVGAAGFPLSYVDVVGFDRSKPWRLPLTGVRAVRAISAARRLLDDENPDVVVGMGGYVSLPACVAAWREKIPTVIHEQNIVLGMTNRVCKRFARKVAVSFDASLEQAGPRGVCTGNPVRSAIAELDIEAARTAGYQRFRLDPQLRTLLVFGGSLGAARLNEAAIALARSWSGRGGVQILHITGERQTATQEASMNLYRSVPYVEAMGEAYAVADLALCRGGATTVAELCVLGLPSVIVPYPHHRDRQQERHGRLLQAAGAAEVLLDAQADPGRIAALVEPILADETRRAAMSEAARKLGRPDAASALAQVVVEVA